MGRRWLKQACHVVHFRKHCSEFCEKQIDISLLGLPSTGVESEAVVDVQILCGQGWGSCTARSRLQRSSWAPWPGTHSKPAQSTCMTAAAAAAKSLQSCPTLCDPMDGSLPGSPVPGILQARTLEWVTISFSNA